MTARIFPVSAALALLTIGRPGLAQLPPSPIIDMHLHAASAASNGPPPTGICAPGSEMPVWDPARSYSETLGQWLKNPPCANPIWGPATDDEVLARTMEILDRRNIYAVTSGPPPLLQLWREKGGKRIIPGLWFGRMVRSEPTPAQVRDALLQGTYRVFAEVAVQYDGTPADDPLLDPYLGVAEESGIPVGIHIGPGPPGVLYLGTPSTPPPSHYRARLHSSLILEEALAKHPGIRLYIMHAGWPMLDDLIAVLYAHPQVYVDTGVISYVLPRPEFHRYLQRIVEAGFGKRVMFGSDQMNWPGAIETALESIESASFLSEDQKRDILFNNAARFLRLSPEEIAAMEGRGADKRDPGPGGE